jgi:hypothetical protein
VFFRVLGAFDILDGGLQLPQIERRLLAALLVRANTVVGVDGRPASATARSSSKVTSSGRGCAELLAS